MMRIQYLSKKSVKGILQALESRREIDPSFVAMLKDAEEVKVVYSEKFEIVVFDDKIALFKRADLDIYMPTLYIVNVLYNTQKLLVVPTVVVDEGAVAPLKRGADVMLPGIKKVLKDFSKGDIVAVMDPSERYLLVIGLALTSSSAIAPGAKGKGIENVSHIEDDLWKSCLQLAKTFSHK